MARRELVDRPQRPRRQHGPIFFGNHLAFLDPRPAQPVDRLQHLHERVTMYLVLQTIFVETVREIIGDTLVAILGSQLMVNRQSIPRVIAERAANVVVLACLRELQLLPSVQVDNRPGDH